MKVFNGILGPFGYFQISKLDPKWRGRESIEISGNTLSSTII